MSKYADDCEKAYRAFNPHLVTVIGQHLKAGCDCEYCSKVKQAASAAAMVEHAVRLQALAAGDMNSGAFKPLFELLRNHIKQVRAERDLLAQANAPTTYTQN